jgi:hypothetical protein
MEKNVRNVRGLESAIGAKAMGKEGITLTLAHVRVVVVMGLVCAVNARDLGIISPVCGICFL